MNLVLCKWMLELRGKAVISDKSRFISYVYICSWEKMIYSCGEKVYVFFFSSSFSSSLSSHHPHHRHHHQPQHIIIINVFTIVINLIIIFSLFFSSFFFSHLVYSFMRLCVCVFCLSERHKICLVFANISMAVFS